MTFEDIYLEIQEMVQDESAGMQTKIESAINEVYREICSMRTMNWRWLHKSKNYYTAAGYNTGTITVTNGSTAITGTGTEFTSSMADMKLVFPDFPEINIIASVEGDEALTLSAAYQGDDDDGSFLIYQNELDLPADFRRPLKVKLNGLPLDQLDLRKYREKQESWSTARPSGYTIDGTKLILDPIPDAKYLVEVFYYAKATDLSADPDEPLIPSEFQHILIYGGYVRLCEKDGDIEFNQVYQNRYQEILADLIADNEQDSDMEDEFEPE